MTGQLELDAELRRDRFRGVILGTAVGDALGLPLEGLSPERARRLFPPPLRHRLLPGCGMLSDDTEHTLFVSQSLLAHPHDPKRFGARLGWCLRGWVLGLPAGVGFATLRACGKLLIGFPPSRSGVFSAGNGPAMRVAPLGAFLAGRPQHFESYLGAVTRVTHTDPKALIGARAVALAVAWCMRRPSGSREPPSLVELEELLLAAGQGNPEWESITRELVAAAAERIPVGQYARRIGLDRGVTGYIYHTVPVALYAWQRHFGDFRDTLESILELGGDTDTVGAVAGALAGAGRGASGIPERWVAGIRDWPRTVAVLTEAADRLSIASTGSDTTPVRYFWPGVLVRNAAFLIIILAHGFRRLLPAVPASWRRRQG